MRASETERLLCGAEITRELIDHARRAIGHEIAPITDLRSTEHYRRTVTGNLLVKLLRQLSV
jgi:xanthine dehydrogenase iron-sulfur cluster and FAD-binding subunit A